MNTKETVQLTRLVAALVPGTIINNDTTVAWAMVLDDVSFEDAQKALRTVYRNQGDDREYGQRRIEPDDILREVKRIRRDRCEAGSAYIPSRPGMSELEQIAEQREHWRRIGDGLPGIEPAGELKPRPALGVLTRTIEDV